MPPAGDVGQTHFMIPSMRWFGPSDPVSLRDIRQSGATEVVTALHDIENGEVWSRDAIAHRRREIEAAGLGWSVVESLPVHDAIKTKGAEWSARIDAYRQSLVNLAACGIRAVTYNFMPLLDWTRTDLAWPMPDGALALRFEMVAAAVFDLHILGRRGAEADYAPALIEEAARRFHAMDGVHRDQLERTIIAGLPGSEEGFSIDLFRAAMAQYDGIDAKVLRANHVAFLEAVCPVADELGIQLVVHPDDPPFPLFGLPRVVSTEQDLADLFAKVPNPSNGVCFCVASFGMRADNDVTGMIARLGSRIGFFHLRSIEREGGDGTFFEAAHLAGDTDMVAVVAEIHALQQREGRSIPMRPDHGHKMLDDLTKKTLPGYSLLGRMRGLSELRGLERGVAHAAAGVRRQAGA